jgi:iron complex transport system ATP-binding protein
MTPALLAEDITFRIGRKNLIADISLAFNPGETVAMVGPNGAGKTTLLRVLSGELRAQAGTIRLKERPIAAYGPRELALHRAVLSQSFGVAFPFKVREIVRMGAGSESGRAIDALIDATLAEVDLIDFSERVITTLSGGEQQRTHFARVLVQLACGERKYGPGVLLLDEPTASLDLKHQIDLLLMARRCAARGVTVVAILHDLNLATLLGERIVVLQDGRIVRDGPPSESVTSDMVRQVFGIAMPVGSVPPAGVPFVLPQAAMRLAPN